MKKKALFLAVVMIFTIFQFSPTVVSALSYDLTTGSVINSYKITSNVVTLYIGNVSVDGTSQLKYLYTDKSVNTAVLSEIKKILPTDYANILPTSEGQVKVSNDNAETVDSTFTSAAAVAASKYSGTVSDTSSTILYNQTQYNSLVTESATEVADEKTAEADNLSAYNTRRSIWDAAEQAKVTAAQAQGKTYNAVDCPEVYVKAFDDSTEYPTDEYFIADSKGNSGTSYIIRPSDSGSDVEVAEVKTYLIDRTIIKVVNTSANVATSGYTILDGANQSYVIANGQDLTVRASGDISKFVRLKIDGSPLDTSYYEVKSGSTIATIKAAYLSTLTEGTHTLTFVYDDGEVSTGFTVSKTATSTTATSTTKKSPLTGDKELVLSLSLMLMIAAVIAVRPKKDVILMD